MQVALLFQAKGLYFAPGRSAFPKRLVTEIEGCLRKDGLLNYLQPGVGGRAFTGEESITPTHRLTQAL